jgi:hypothetical protein
MRGSGTLRRELSAKNQQIAMTSGSLYELTAGETFERAVAALALCPARVPRGSNYAVSRGD